LQKREKTAAGHNWHMTMPRIKMVHKVLLLVAVPLVFQVLFVVVLESLWQQTRTLKRASERTARILIGGQRLISKLEQENVPSQELAFLTAKLQRPMRSSSKYNEQIEDLKRFETAFAAAATTTGGANANEYKRRIDLKMYVQRLLAEEEASLAPDKAPSFEDAEQNIHRMIGLALTLNVLVCVLLIYYFSLHFASRLRVLVANGERFTEGKELLPPPSGNDEINEVDKVFRDMTDAIQKTREREHQFLSMVSHDLKTPLNTVLATLNSLSEGIYGTISETGLQRVRKSELAIERLNRLTNDLLNFEKLSSGTVSLQLVPVSVYKVLTNAVESVAGFSDFKGVEIRFSHSALTVMADEEKLVQVIVNLLSNAIKFSSANSSIDIEVREMGSSNVEIRVIDKGCGISEQDQVRIFEPFRQGKTQPEQQGSGLGLSICKSLIEAQMGTIGFSSRENIGSQFYVRLRKSQEISSVPEKISSITT